MEERKGMRAIEKQVVTVAHEHSQLQKRHQFVADHLGRNRICDSGINELIQREGWQCGLVSGVIEGRVDYRNSHSHDEMPQRQQLLLHICIMRSCSFPSVKMAHFRAASRLTPAWNYPDLPLRLRCMGLMSADV
ncbi:hypothetical protein EVAR_14198_1 [Eumeta japonica]|uniref:Uncharacterized protein n=1 Tax=Eumeta variegata TaxID=151549 RepID=A0A4C1UEJ4_EUMVA|nr:hypothetical protein EVAR_14198_1 [Eumeta japonica]